MGFKEVKRFNHSALELEILQKWKEKDIFRKSVDQREHAPTFAFYEGPPTANGRPGIHHVLARTIKDTFCRYRTMKGYRVERKGGWDTHGLPVEIEVEKELGLEGRHQVEEFGIVPYNAACRESVLRYKEQWDDLTVRMGYWVDLEHPYITFTNEYIESVWWLLKQIYNKGLLKKGYKIQWYSPGSSTVLSSHEVSLGYQEVQDPSVYVRFMIRGEPDTYFLAWTTTPWTLISNTALAVGPHIDYVKIRHVDPHHGEEIIILAKDRLSVIDGDYVVLETVKGSLLLGQSYVPLFPYFVEDEGADRAWRVVEADFVSTEDGTGIVHMAPAFGAEDFEVGEREGMPLFNPITSEGVFTEKVQLVAGRWFKDADESIVDDLRERGLLYRKETYLHNYPHDWRKGTPLLSYPVESWFVCTTSLKDRLIELNDTIGWQPRAIGTGRFGEWLRNNVDWALSRWRYWGTPLPIWQSDKPGSEYIEVIGSIEELREKCGDQIPVASELDLHRPYVDSYTWTAPDGGTMRRVPDVIDCWFDSGAMPFAQWHYPFEHKEDFERNFPADFIAEGVDQTRGWFYTLHAIATLVMDSVAYKNVVVNGLVLAEDGEKMSKSKGNAVDPFGTIDTYGADLVRWYMMSNSPPWENIKFSERGLLETLRKFFNTLENIYSFFATYANIDGFSNVDPVMPVAERTELDRWVISRLNSTISEVDTAYTEYNPTKAARTIERFVDELSNWYIRRSRRRFWKEETDAYDKRAAYQTVFECLLTVAGLMSPIAPFFGEWLYLALSDETNESMPQSVHLTSFPEIDHESVDHELEHRMGLARDITSIVLSERNKSGINVRQPLSRIMVVTEAGIEKKDVETVRNIILEEVNIKDIVYVAGSSGIVKRTAKPNFKRLGKRLGKLMKPANAAVRQMTEQQIDEYLGGSYVLDINGTSVELFVGDIEITSEGIEGWLIEQEGGITIALDTTITEELMAEGLARETVNRLQNMRKAADFEVTDRIVVAYRSTGGLSKAIQDHIEWIRNETLAVEFEQTEEPSGVISETFVIGQDKLTLALSKV